MKNGLFILLLAVSFVACKSDKKNDNIQTENIDSETADETENFENSLLDYRDINERFLDDYKVQKFGIQKTNDSLIGFVFKLNDSTSSATVEAYSLGIRVFDRTLAEPLSMSFHPILKEIEGDKYIIVSRVITETKYVDSISAY